MTLTCVGIGPGGGDDMTLRARTALEAAELIVGYTTYVKLVQKDFPHKEYLATGMRGEVERCRMALERAAEGKRVAVICSGDPGIYGMAGLLLELAPEYPGVEVEVIPGVTAANGGAAILGAPLMHDWCSISLSDLMTPWEVIERRLTAAAQADFCIALYNPSSRGRQDYLQRACDVLLKARSPKTVCGCVRNVGREGEERRVLTLEELRDAQADMLTCVFVGNSQTCVVNGRMVTPRGYRLGDS
ncbi:MAG: precorrin-3B C(17)-methyltransferase [Atopobiaceae bacterium]|nr:precorrin-3B C(17)-methyltransferase [Atopobiaceae bacterium]MBR1829372.1 precorrin-3B C(17)-methyltransferase [Atopobiaceae bacterium]